MLSAVELNTEARRKNQDCQFVPIVRRGGSGGGENKKSENKKNDELFANKMNENLDPDSETYIPLTLDITNTANESELVKEKQDV
jgi:hypothetical protein